MGGVVTEVAATHGRLASKEQVMTVSTTVPAAKKSAKAPKATNGKPEKKGLRKPQVRVLAALKKASKPLSRAEISEKAPCDGPMLNSYIGSHDEAIRHSNDVKNFPSLLTLKAVKFANDDGEGGGARYEITAPGKKLLEVALKAEAAS